MRTWIRSSSVIALLLIGSVGCRSVVAPRTPQIRTIASIGDRPKSAGAGEPGDLQETEPEEKPKVADEDREIQGRVVDDRGRPVANAKVRLAVDGSGAGKVVKTSTDETGRFTLHELRPDTDYTLIAEDEDGTAQGRASAVTADRRVKITLKNNAKVQRVSDQEEEEPASTDSSQQAIPPPPDSASLLETRRDRATSRASTGKTVAWKGASTGKEIEPEPEASPSPREEPRDLPIVKPTSPDRDDLPAPKSSEAVKTEPETPIEKPAPRRESAPEPEPEPIGSAPVAEPPSRIEPKPIETPEPTRFEPEPAPLSTPAPAAPPVEPAPEPASAPIVEPLATRPEEPKADSNPAPPESTVVEPPSAPAPAGEIVAPPPSSAPIEPQPPVEAPAATQVSSLKRPTWGELSSRKTPQLALNAPSGRRRFLGQNKVSATGEKANASEIVVEPACQYDPKSQRLVNFRLPDLDGKPVELRDIDGDLILIDFWGTWCAPCLESIPHLVQLQQQYGDRLRVVGIAYEEGASAEQAKAVEAVARKLGINYTLLLGGSDGQPCPVQAAFHVQAYPTMVLIDRQGRVLWKDSGAGSRTLARLDYKVSSMVGSNVVRR